MDGSLCPMTRMGSEVAVIAQEINTRDRDDVFSGTPPF